ncbi:MAG: hypothetical protein JWQ07_5369 [Ramlibacter sp.]|nr:hypothetical protein [Ramlibacter sp.]
MDRTRAFGKTAVVALTTCAVAAVPAVASAGSPPSSWTNLRTMSCDGATVEAAFAPGGVFTSFHVLGSSDVIVPKHVEVVFPGTTQPVTTLDVPGFDNNKRGVVTCQYVDPAGLAVTIVGIRT